MPKHAVAKLIKGREKRLRAGHLWVYTGEIADLNGRPEPGGLVDVISHNGHFLGRGYYNPASQIAVRLLTRDEVDIDTAFFTRRISEALAYRQRFMPEQEAYRVVHGEGDLLPGLVLDKFGSVLVAQILTLGIDVRRSQILSAIEHAFGTAGIDIDGIYERSDVNVRRLEGLEEKKGFLVGRFDTRFQTMENGIKFMVDVEEGQKTGYFLDQKENRRALEPLVDDGARVLDAFCHTGTFGHHAAHYGAGKVVFLDASDLALKVAQANAEANGWAEKCEYKMGNAFDLLRQMERDGEKFDVTVLDPPAFTKSKDSVEAAIRGYKEINIRGMKLTKPGGFLVTCSCSHHMARDMFLQLVLDAGLDAGRKLRLVEVRTQAKDHPILCGMPETEYLKCIIMQII